jgi:tricorn protease
MKKNVLWLVTAILLMGILCLPNTTFGNTDNPLLLLRYPSMSKTAIIFEYGGKLWTVPRKGGRARVLATGLYISGSGSFTMKPTFSPNGKWIAFTGTYDHNTDVYAVPADGGQPKRLTYHPGPDVAVGWTPDSKHILFRSHRYSYSDPNQLYTVPITGGFPQRIPLPMAETGSYSPDGSHIAYVPNFQWEPFWKSYKGGQHTQIWISRLSDLHTVRVPNLNSNENDPMWVGNTIYFLSDREGPITLFSYNVKTNKVKKLINNSGFDITSASVGPGGIVYSQFGRLHIYDFASRKTHAVSITVNGDLLQRRPRYEKVAKQIMASSISPTGIRAVFSAHGDILTVPAKHGSVVNITHSPGAMDRDPAWSPNGKFIAYFSDKEGEYDLYVSPQSGNGSIRKITLSQNDAFYYDLSWSPDSKKVVFNDQKGNLWFVNLESDNHHPIKVANSSSGFAFENIDFDTNWSPDSRWIAFTKVLPNFMDGIFIYSLADGKTHQITNGMSDCGSPRFDPNGKYLYFLSSTNSGPSIGTDISVLGHPITTYVYAATLEHTTPSPVAPKSGFEKVKYTQSKKSNAKSDKTKKKKQSKVSIDFRDLASRIVSLPVKPAFYNDIEIAKSGVLYLEKSPRVILPSDYNPDGLPIFSIERFTLKNKKTEPVVQHVLSFSLSSNGEKMLYQQGKDWFISSANPKAKPRKLNLSSMRVFVKPHEQWKQMYHDAWRVERAFFYSPIFDGLNIDKAEKEFAHYLPGIASRDGLSFLFREMLSYISVGHMFIVGGYAPKTDQVRVGLLGANYKVEQGHYRITRIFTGAKWNPQLYAPLAQPGLNVKTGDYVLAVNGRPIVAKQSIYKVFVNLAGKTVTLTVGPNPSMDGSHDIIVKTIPSEAGLRHAAWIAHNTKLVNKLSGGKLAYIYLPDTEWGGFSNFNRYYFSQVDKQGAVIDERFNHGGMLSDYIINYLTRKPMGLLVTRLGKRTTATAPTMIIAGPKVLVINQFSGSGGDALPWYFKMDSVGTLVGVRTWGGLVGIGDYPKLMDGGTVTAPRIAVEGLHGKFPVENRGISPDVEIWQDPQKVREGRDPQLEAAVEIALQKLKENPPKQYKPAPWRNYQPKLPPLPPVNSSSKSS